VWMEYERHDDGDVDPFPPEELAWIFYWWYIKLCPLDVRAWIPSAL